MILDLQINECVPDTFKMTFSKFKIFSACSKPITRFSADDLNDNDNDYR